MTKCVLWLLFAAISAAFAMTLVLQQRRAYWDEHSRSIAEPAAYYVQVMEPKARDRQRAARNEAARAVAAVTGGTTTQPTR